MDPLQTDYLNYKLIDGPLLVENMKVFQGANYFSGGPVLLIRLNLGSFDEVFTNQINGFFENLSALIPSLSEHHCSEARKGGFFFRVKEGTLLGHVIEHVALELQTLAGMDAGYGKTRSTLTQGVYNIIFRFLDEEAGLYAGKAAVNLVNSILLNMEFGLNKIIEDLINIREKNLLGPSTQAIVDEAEKRKIPALRLDDYNLVQLGTGKFNKKIRATITSDTNLIAVETADSKYLTTLMLKDAGIPVLETIKTDSAEDVIAFGERINSAIVIKPSEAYQGKNLRIDLTGKDEIEEAFNYAMQFNQEVIAQPYFKGNSYRLLVINFKFVAAAELIPPFITGNGKATILAKRR
jgi:cyanophycin synthetase